MIQVDTGWLMPQLTERLRGYRVRNGAIVSIVGAADNFMLSTMPADDATKDVITTHVYPAEMSGTGEVVDGQPHIHAVMAVAGDQALSGHLHDAYVETHFVRVYVIPV